LVKIDLLPAYRRLSSRRRRARFGLQALALSLLATVALYTWTTWRQFSYYRAELEKIVEQRRQYTQAEDRARQVANLEQALAQRRALLKSWQGSRQGSVVRELETLLPRGTTLTEMTIKGSEVTLKGRAESLQQVADLVEYINRSRHLARAAVVSAQAEGKGSYLFQVTARAGEGGGR